jgi:hypothetical protein
VNRFIAGCAKTHLLAKSFASTRSEPSARGCIAPLAFIAEDLVNGWDALTYLNVSTS